MLTKHLLGPMGQPVAVTEEVLYDGSTIQQIRDQLLGNHKGLDALRKMLNEREADLIERIKKDEQK